MRITTVADIIREHGAVRPEVAALVYGDRTLTYGDLDERSSRFANGLAAEGVGPQDRVAYLDRNAPEFVLGFYDLGVANYHRGNMFAAAESFGRCLLINPDYKAAHYRLALSLFHMGHLDEALEHFKKAMILTPEYLMAHYHMGVIHERRGELDLAVREFQKSLDEGLGEMSSLHHLTTIRARNGKQESDRHLERVTE